MAQISLEKITKVYPNGFEAVHALDLEVNEGEFMVLVGPSGCGKTTALRMVAGLEVISRGTLRFGERVVNNVSAKNRDIAMVFQNYALYPHMTVGENIGFALRTKKLPKALIKEKVTTAAGILGLTELIDSKPGQLSGGQRQRVAMGRAIVREPSVFLMDEPLSNLDAKLRVQMRAEVTRIQRRLGVATLYVTHDQVEAMTMGDRVAVLRAGVLQQCDRPQALYDNPNNLFVAAFIGSPAMNLFEAQITEGASTVIIGSQRIELGEAVLAHRPAVRAYANRRVVLGIRPEDLPMASSDEGSALVGEVELVEALGSDLLIHFAIDANRVEVEGALEDDDASLSPVMLQRAQGVARIAPRSPVEAGDRVRLSVNPIRLHFFDPESGVAIVD
ncbi:MAG: sn-glycerol-3-phosphate ABC transporter ATP-binding protein UgpC [Acidimicrobiales bacterium]|jgi:multiple sugar transport system ATP-binding protein